MENTHASNMLANGARTIANQNTNRNETARLKVLHNYIKIIIGQFNQNWRKHNNDDVRRKEIQMFRIWLKYFNIIVYE